MISRQQEICENSYLVLIRDYRPFGVVIKIIGAPNSVLFNPIKTQKQKVTTTNKNYYSDKRD